MDVDYLEQIQELDNVHQVHYIQLKQIENDEQIFLAKYSSIDALPEQEDIIKKFGAGVYVFTVTYFDSTDEPKKRRVKSFKLGRLGKEQESEEMNEQTAQALSLLAQGMQQNNELLKRLLEKESRPQPEKNNLNELVVSKLIDKALNSEKNSFEMFFKGMQTASDFIPEPEEKESIDLSSLAGLFGNKVKENASSPSALDSL